MFEEMLKKLCEEKKDVIGDMIKDRLNEAINEPVVVSVKKDKSGKAETQIEGGRLAILLTLAGLENSVLKKLNTPSELFEMLKGMVDTEEVSK